MASLQDEFSFNKQALCEFLTFDRCFLTDSMIDGIKLFGSDNYLLITDEYCEIYSKDIGNITDKSIISSPKKFFENMVYALNKNRVVCALTGGYDSRLIAAAYNYYSSSDCFISGDNLEGADIQCAKKAAKAGNMKLRHIVPLKSNKKADELIADIFENGEYKEIIDTSAYRINYFMDQLESDYDILLTGNAGDMHKGFWDVRLLPFYPRGKNADMRRFARKYFIGKDKSDYLAESLLGEYKTLIQYTYNYFDNLKVDNDVIRSCLQGGWCDWVPAGLKYTETGSLKTYAPLQEFELVKFSYGISPRGKRLNMFHRKLLSFYNRPMARIKTIYRTSASSEFPYICIDMIAMFSYYAELVIKYIIRKMFHVNTRVNQYVNKMDLTPMIRQSETAEKAFIWAKEKGYISRETSVENFPEKMLGKVLYVYLLELAIKEHKNIK